MNKHQRNRLEWKKQAAILSNLAETYIAKEMNTGFFDPNLGEYDVIFTRVLAPKQNGFTSFFQMADLIFYPKNIEDFSWISEFLHFGIAINLSALRIAKYKPASLNESQAKQWEFIGQLVDHALHRLFDDFILDQFHNLILETQHEFGEFENYPAGESGNYPSTMDTIEIMGLVTTELNERLQRVLQPHS